MSELIIGEIPGSNFSFWQHLYANFHQYEAVVVTFCQILVQLSRFSSGSNIATVL